MKNDIKKENATHVCLEQIYGFSYDNPIFDKRYCTDSQLKKEAKKSLIIDIGDFLIADDRYYQFNSSDHNLLSIEFDKVLKISDLDSDELDAILMKLRHKREEVLKVHAEVAGLRDYVIPLLISTSFKFNYLSEFGLSGTERIFTEIQNYVDFNNIIKVLPIIEKEKTIDYGSIKHEVSNLILRNKKIEYTSFYNDREIEVSIEISELANFDEIARSTKVENYVDDNMNNIKVHNYYYELNRLIHGGVEGNLQFTYYSQTEKQKELLYNLIGIKEK